MGRVSMLEATVVFLGNTFVTNDLIVVLFMDLLHPINYTHMLMFMHILLSLTLIADEKFGVHLQSP